MKSLKEIIQNHNNICWYPSAGADFRVLMFLSEQYCKWKNVDIEKNILPDLFILTDCNPQDISFVDRRGVSNVGKLNGDNAKELKTLFGSFDGETTISVKEIELLEDLVIQFDKTLCNIGLSDNYGKSYYMRVHINSEQLGEWDTDVVYLLTENTGFALKYLIPMGITIDYLVRVRYGDFFGGSRLYGEWLLKLLKPLNVKYFLSNEINETSFSYVPEQLNSSYSNLREVWGSVEVIPLSEVFCVAGRTWSDQGDIHWYRVTY